MWFSFLSIYGPCCRPIMPHVAHILYVCCRFSYSIYNIADLHFLIYCMYTHPHVCTRTSVWVHWNMALDVPISVAVYFLSITTFSISCLQYNIFFQWTKKKKVLKIRVCPGFHTTFSFFSSSPHAALFTPKTDCFNSPDFCLLLSHELAIPSV